VNATGKTRPQNNTPAIKGVLPKGMLTVICGVPSDIEGW